MSNSVNFTFLSLIILTFLIFLSLSWLVSRTLKEGEKALKEIVEDSE